MLDRHKYLFLILMSFLLCPPLSAATTNEYIVTFRGIEHHDTIELLRNASQLVALEELPPKTLSALKRRTENDIPNLVKALHSQAYYGARIDWKVLETTTPKEVIITIETGPVFPLTCLKVIPETLNIRPRHLGITLNKPAYPSDILDAEESLICLMARRGYPLARLVDREVTADLENNEIFVTLHIDTGPLAYFGETTIEGNCGVREDFIRRKIDWCEGEIYDPEKIESTVSALEAAGVFSTIGIAHDEELSPDGTLSMRIQVSEGKQRSIGFGVSYSTQRGPGFTAEWEHRNVRGMGERFSFDTKVLQHTQDARLTYIKPDFRCRGQDLVLVTELEHELTEGYEKTSFIASGSIEKQINEQLRFSYGLMYENLKSKDEEKDGSRKVETHNLIKTPIQLRWSSADDPLDPSCGATLFLRTTPSLQTWEDPFLYTVSTLTGSIYRPLSWDRRFILAAKANFGAIFGSSRNTIPNPELFHAGSENTLRGYNYLTVSAISEDNDPVGGRSMMIYTLEGRWRMSDTWGAVFFYDIGHVFSSSLPRFNRKMLQSVGIGARYFTPVGPIRLDVAYPLDRRKDVDDAFQIYFSVGQAF